MDAPNIARIATLLGDNARAEVLSALMADRALTATELADVAGVSRQTISSHLAKLVDAGLVTVSRQGRHRYFRLPGPDVAHLLESLMGVAFRHDSLSLSPGPHDMALRKARVCYDHLAGELAVLAYEGLLQQNVLQLEAGAPRLTERGRDWFQQLGIDTDLVAAQSRTFCRACLDWSERRDHLAGALGAALLRRIKQVGWIKLKQASRVVTFTPTGEIAFRALFQAGPAGGSGCAGFDVGCERISINERLRRPKACR